MRRHTLRLVTLAIVLTSLACGGGGSGDPPSEATVRQPGFRCQGNEPFWNLRIEGTQASYRSLAGGESEALFEGEFQWDRSVEPPLFEWQGVDPSDTAARLSASIREELCLDTMSEETPPFTHWIRLRTPDGHEVAGCCRTEEAPMPEPDTIALDELPVANLDLLDDDEWAHDLFDLLPALDACFGRMNGSSPRVTYAWSFDDGMVGVRLRDGEGGWFECVASRGGSSIDRFDRLTTADFPLQHENRLVFTRAEQNPPSGNCYEHERVLDAQGEPIGWLSFNTC
jgi:uncharacterized membrane protein